MAPANVVQRTLKKRGLLFDEFVLLVMGRAATCRHVLSRQSMQASLQVVAGREVCQWVGFPIRVCWAEARAIVTMRLAATTRKIFLIRVSLAACDVRWHALD